VIILGTDSGVERTGYAVFHKNGRDYKLESYGYIFTEKKYSLPYRLKLIHDEFAAVLTKSKPDIIIVEQILFQNNQKTMVSIAQAQGVLLALAGELGIEVVYLTPPQIKLTITGNGTADKKAVQKMVQIQLQMKEMPKPDDVVDAIACGMAYCILN
jgi:crossover junction endodeoxyribonuclease RuvC